MPFLSASLVKRSRDSRVFATAVAQNALRRGAPAASESGIVVRSDDAGRPVVNEQDVGRAQLSGAPDLVFGEVDVMLLRALMDLAERRPREPPVFGAMDSGACRL